MAQITRRETIYEGWSIFHKIFIRLPDGSEIVREVQSHGDAVAVLPYDSDRRTCWLISTARAPVLMAGAHPLLEAPAGFIDEGENPEEAARREAEEEIGLRLQGLEGLGLFWPSPGMGCERLHLFLAETSPADRVSEGGGLTEENEQLVVTERSLAVISTLGFPRSRQLRSSSVTLNLCAADWMRLPGLVTLGVCNAHDTVKPGDGVTHPWRLQRFFALLGEGVLPGAEMFAVRIDRAWSRASVGEFLGDNAVVSGLFTRGRGRPAPCGQGVISTDFICGDTPQRAWIRSVRRRARPHR